jgi:hypothetical protein
MIQLQQIDTEKLKEVLKLKESDYSLIYLNYDKKSGIKIVDSIENLSVDDLKDFYRIYAFNDDFMITVYKFRENDYRYNEIEKSDFEKLEEKNIYIDTKGLNSAKKLIVRKGLIKDKEYIQYVEFVTE